MRVFTSDYRDAASNRFPDPFPVHVLKRVDRPTTKILDDQVQRVDERESGFNRARRGDFGPRLKEEFESEKEEKHGAETRDGGYRQG